MHYLRVAPAVADIEVWNTLDDPDSEKGIRIHHIGWMETPISIGNNIARASTSLPLPVFPPSQGDTPNARMPRSPPHFHPPSVARTHSCNRRSKSWAIQVPNLHIINGIRKSHSCHRPSRGRRRLALDSRRQGRKQRPSRPASLSRSMRRRLHLGSLCLSQQKTKSHWLIAISMTACRPPATL